MEGAIHHCRLCDCGASGFQPQAVQPQAVGLRCIGDQAPYLDGVGLRLDLGQLFWAEEQSMMNSDEPPPSTFVCTAESGRYYHHGVVS
jgi:hypothetical protein